MDNTAQSAVPDRDIMTSDFAQRVLDIIATEGAVDRTKLKPGATLEELEVASIGVVMILNGLEEEFSISFPIDQSISEVKTVRDLVIAVHEPAAMPPLPSP
jgi:acyl carrier protein